jgi:hypothetical protein
MRERLLGITFDEGLDEGRFAHARRPNHSHDDWRSLLGQAIHQGDMEAFFFDLVVVRKLGPRTKTIVGTCVILDLEPTS